MTELWHFLVFALELFVLFAFLIVLFQIVGDLFSDHSLGGFAKAIWVIVLVIFPIIGSIIYLIARGKGMTKRRLAQVEAAQAQTETYIRTAARKGSATELAAAKHLLDSGTISQAEFDKIKAEVVGA